MGVAEKVPHMCKYPGVSADYCPSPNRLKSVIAGGCGVAASITPVRSVLRLKLWHCLHIVMEELR